MAGKPREGQLLQTFVALADTLVADYDVVELLHVLVERCVTLLDVAAAGILLIGDDGTLEVVASTNERSRLVELMQLSVGAGPCLDSISTGLPVTIPDIREATSEWPMFASSAIEQGFGSLHAVPLRLRDTVIGSLNLFWDTTGTPDPDDAALARALADVATIGVIQQRALRENDIAREQLQRALDSRVIIEQAKGVLAYRHSSDMDAAFALLRGHARETRQPLAEVASQVVSRSLLL